ncbi:hypothetical protein GPK34_00185 [Secundilactobacillus kimchicus]|uniref:Uncharacterized protein n=1 Tax=Secundilactobacillus kimchicus JCM 15530 TaxID=1302272 RepID=A0A0R1HST6_9LACO|nr:hypothetical protein [Secundilactobacillus kimchicus]KRK46788.1 hypothetical protein FC96_GL000932 [Secundilactobacillus kimchicus JCM 15530]MBT9670454.1 hypothetical protein [Secundilactobacillus kimchicus]
MVKRLGWFLVGIGCVGVGVGGFWWAILGSLADHQGLLWGSSSALFLILGIGAVYKALKV